MLGTSRGGADIPTIVKRLSVAAVDMVFVIGGNGGNAGAAAIQAECERQGVVCSVVGVPKSIDNDILLIDKCFGFDTAVEEAQRALLAAKVEASSAYRGVGVVRLMGRQSGFIAMQASMASGVVDVCLIPEVPFALGGRRGLASFVQRALDERGHAVICVAEGAGQDVVGGGEHAADASGNPILADVGAWLKSELKKRVPGVDVKYIDPSYMIRATPTNAADRVLCKILAHNAVHAAFGGYTGITVGLVNTHYVYLPIPVIIQARGAGGGVWAARGGVPFSPLPPPLCRLRAGSTPVASSGTAYARRSASPTLWTTTGTTFDLGGKRGGRRERERRRCNTPHSSLFTPASASRHHGGQAHAAGAAGAPAGARGGRDGAARRRRRAARAPARPPPAPWRACGEARRAPASGRARDRRQPPRADTPPSLLPSSVQGRRHRPRRHDSLRVGGQHAPRHGGEPRGECPFMIRGISAS